MPALVFDIETIPDVAGIRVLHGLPADLSDYEVAEFAFQQRRAASGTDFLPHHLQRVVTISCVLRDAAQFRVFSLSEPDATEAQIIQRFFDGIEKFAPQLISWNGGGFDLPVLHYRGLIHGVSAARYWDLGDGDFADSRDYAPLDDLAKLMGFPGKLGMDGGAVWEAYQAGRIAEIRDYCETDVVNTYLVHLRFQQMRGQIDQAGFETECAFVRDSLTRIGAPHWRVFLDAWR